MRAVTLSVVVGCLFASTSMATYAQERTAAVPQDAAGAILEAFSTHDIVTIQNSHGEIEIEEFVLSLIQDERFAMTVDVIVMEGWNARYQGLVDRYVNGEPVPYTELRQAWEDGTQAQVIPPRDGTIPEMLTIVRRLNMPLPGNQRLRVLLGEPPIDWSQVHTPADFRRWIEMREWHPASLIQLEVLAKGRSALLVYGQGHAQRRNALANYDMSDWRAQTIVSILERTTPARIFSVWWEGEMNVLPGDVASWPVPSAALLDGTELGAIDFAEFSPTDARFAVEDGRLVPVPEEEWRSLPIEEQFDALLFLGPRSEMTVRDALVPEVCADPGYLEMRLQRMEMVRAGSPDATQRYRDYCALQ